MKTQEKTNTKRFMLYLPEALDEMLRQEAQEEYRSINGEVLFILEQFFTRKKNATE
ncbi:MAG TPA: Arc family DNA-binding protein [Ktedonobacteraceae bacterium]|nr:Arc family DNA-binding protein [Ktedonobacteraceae bacterium]